MSISADSASPRRDFFMNNAYEGTAMETRIDTMATATMSSMSVMPRVRLPAMSAVRQVPGRYMSVSSHHYALTYHRNSPPCSVHQSMSCRGSDGRSNRADRGRQHSCAVRASACELHQFVTCTGLRIALVCELRVFLRSECDGVPLRDAGTGPRSRLTGGVATPLRF